MTILRTPKIMVDLLNKYHGNDLEVLTITIIHSVFKIRWLNQKISQDQVLTVCIHSFG